MKARLDERLVALRMAQSRSQAANLIKLGKVFIDGASFTKPGHMVRDDQTVTMESSETYVSRAGFKLASANEVFAINFNGTVVLDVGSSTGGFTDYALQHGASKVIAVDVGTDQLHPSLRTDQRIELHEKTDIRDFETKSAIDVVVIDVSFISLREILPTVKRFCNQKTQVVAMLKPQFEAGDKAKHKGVIKNSKLRRQIIKDFELWAKQYFVILNSRDSGVSGAKGNQEKFYLLKKI